MKQFILTDWRTNEQWIHGKGHKISAPYSHLDAKRVPIIAMTANAFKEDVEKALAAGMNAHLAKPINIEILYKTLAEVAE